MKSFLLYILESSICISVLYLLFRIILRKESSFGVNRTTLLAVIVFSIVIPFLQLPQQMQTPVHLVIFPELQVDQLPVQRQTIDLQNKETLEEIQPIRFESTNVTTPEKKLSISAIDLIKYIYLAGVLVAFTLLIRNIILILMLFRKARVVKKVDYRLLIVDGEVPSFAFGHSVMISQKDFDLHGSAIITHEQSHIRLNHFYDLILLELVRIFHWFNPLVYHLIRDMKEIHEYQADNSTLQSGIDATKYQLLIIQKSVGPKRFALANSFNHCQIKNRIVMMNKLKDSKAWRWKVAAFLPLLALLLMAFGKPGEKITAKKESAEVVLPQDTVKKAKLGSHIKLIPPPLFIDIKQEGIYLMNKLVTLDEFRKEVPLVIKKNPQSGVIVNIQDTRNKDLKTVEEILKKEGAKTVKYRQTMKFTPPTIKKRLPFIILVDAIGKVSFNIDSLKDKEQVLTKMGEIYRIHFSPEELKTFSSIKSFGVPINRMKAFLDMPNEERNKPGNDLGIPFDSPSNEFKNWVSTARKVVGDDMRLIIMGDPSVSYEVVKKIMGSLQDLKENRYSLFANLELVKGQVREVLMPSKVPAPIPNLPQVKASRAITIILDKDNMFYYYLGTRDPNTGADPTVTKTDLSGLHKVLENLNNVVMDKIAELKQKKDVFKISDEDFQKQKKEIISDKSAPIALIKATDDSNLRNLVDILDEMGFCNIGRFAIVDISAYDKHLMSKDG